MRYGISNFSHWPIRIPFSVEPCFYAFYIFIFPHALLLVFKRISELEHKLQVSRLFISYTCKR